jgi:hypothetical protein
MGAVFPSLDHLALSVSSELARPTVRWDKKWEWAVLKLQEKWASKKVESE